MTNALGDEMGEGIKGRIAMGTFGKPEDVANAVAFFASSESGYITGQVLAVDGGIALQNYQGTKKKGVT